MKVTLSEPGVAGSYVVEERGEDGSLLLRPDTSVEGIRKRIGGRPATTEEFQDLRRNALPADGEG